MIAGAAAAVSFAVAADVIAQGASSRWRTEAGSVLSLEESGDQVSIRYVEVPSAIARAGVTRGTEVFRGRRQGQGFTGTAVAFFTNGCRPRYAMQITFSGDGSRLTTRADAPSGIDASCRVLHTVPRSYTWVRIDAAPPRPDGPAPPLPVVRYLEDGRVTNLRFDCAYNPGIFGNPLAPPPIAIRVQGDARDWRAFTDAGETQGFLDELLALARAHCDAERARKAIRGQVHDVLHVTVGNPRGTVLDGRFSGGRWQFGNNAPQWVEQERREEAARKEREERLAREAKIAADKAAARRRNREQFVSSHRVETLLNARTLKTNPFPFKGKVVGVYTAFSLMLSESEGLFGDLVVSGLPSTAFTVEGQEVVLAVRVIGLRPVKLPMGMEVPLPQGAYVGAFLCRAPRCGDFFDSR
jgi:hypothetical protein